MCVGTEGEQGPQLLCSMGTEGDVGLCRSGPGTLPLGASMPQPKCPKRMPAALLGP